MSNQMKTAANIKRPKPPKPKCKGTLVCVRCHAEYVPRSDWQRGFYIAEGTENPTFVKTMDVPEGHCPMCLYQKGE